MKNDLIRASVAEGPEVWFLLHAIWIGAGWKWSSDRKKENETAVEESIEKEIGSPVIITDVVEGQRVLFGNGLKI